ncbi:protein LNK2 isoform X2 [Morus notabilis]|uniref:protein LNK2 isoform X2 n=1 Tax=Morus notabilis TaxID=981085 RepID=UPI000CED3882|nr:protein LNK2 isoform X2 [Morus notabilis]
MFDWDDAELANIIWDEAAENSDHIVPYPKGTEDCRIKKEWKEESAVIKPTEQKSPRAKVDLNGKIPEGSSSVVKHDGNSAYGIGMEPWSDLPLPNAANTELESVDTEVPTGLTEITKYHSSRDQLDKDDEIYQNSHEVKEQGNFVDYGWANIGSFDDFDRIFSNNDAVFGHVSLDNPDELWSSSRDVANSAAKSFPISSEMPIKTEYVQDDLTCSLQFGKTDDSTSQTLQSVHCILDHVEEASGKSKPMAKEQPDLGKMVQTTVAASHPAAVNIATQNEVSVKLTRQKKPLKSRKRLEEKIEGRPLQELYGAWPSLRNHSGQHENRLAHTTQPSLSSVQQMQLLAPEIFQYQHISNQFAAHPVYGNLKNPYLAMPVLSHIQPGKLKHQPLLSSCDVLAANKNSAKKSAEAPVKPIVMTPQEKIEKLRRRQQLQAMLAIQKQQQELHRQIPSTNHSTTQNFPLENQSQQFGGAYLKIEDLSTFHCLEPNSPVEQDDSSTISAAIDDYSVEETILHRLQDIIKKLDITVRLCIRDSLFRLAQSAVQRHYASDTSSTNKSSKEEREALAKEEINSCSRLPDCETETNPIDRAVAHLLFHIPMELSGKQLEPSESPLSTKLPSEQRAAETIINLPETFINKRCFGHQESKVCSPILVEPDQYKHGPCVDASANASNKGLTYGGAVVAAVESSQ